MLAKKISHILIQNDLTLTHKNVCVLGLEHRGTKKDLPLTQVLLKKDELTKKKSMNKKY